MPQVAFNSRAVGWPQRDNLRRHEKISRPIRAGNEPALASVHVELRAV